MAYDEKLADRIRRVLAKTEGIDEKKMFGGLCFLFDGHMVCGVLGEKVVLRLSPEGAAKALEQPGVTPMDFTGRPMKSMVYVHPEACAGAKLGKWVRQALEHAGTLPPK
jgi:TfoX/Sxy family transcriptional regulator of competence genes